jgi:hypothetical protein
MKIATAHTIEELFRQAGVPSDWAHEFVTESNKMDPQPGSSEPGGVLYDGHYEAVLYALQMAAEDRYALPHAIHRLLLRDHPLVKKLRTHSVKVGSNPNPAVEPKYIRRLFWLWNCSVHQTIDRLRLDGDSVDLDHIVSEVWRLHAEFENIHPYELRTGQVGRVLLVNHALLVDLTPWIIPCCERQDYFDLIQLDPSSRWGVEPPVQPR